MTEQVNPSNDRRLTPIYISWTTFITFLDWLANMVVVPHQIDRSVWAGKFSGAVGAQLMPGLRFLGLLDGEVPQPRLLDLATADGDKRKELLRDLFADVYGAELVNKLPGMTPSMLTNAMRALGATDATVRKAESFFINGAKAIGLNVPPSIAKKARNKPSGRSNGTSTGVRGNSRASVKRGRGAPSKPTVTPVATPPSPAGANTRTVQLRNGGQVTLVYSVDLFDIDEHDQAFLLDLIRKFKEYGQDERVSAGTATV